MKFAILSLFAIFAVNSAQAAYINLGVGQEKRLGSPSNDGCGGTVEASESRQGAGEQVNIVFHGVEQCSNFDIVANNYSLESYKSRKLPNKESRGLGGSFTIPKDKIGDGVNNFVITLKSNKGHHSDTIVVSFNAWHIPTYKPVQPVKPSKPSHSDPVIIVHDTPKGNY